MCRSSTAAHSIGSRSSSPIDVPSTWRRAPALSSSHCVFARTNLMRKPLIELSQSSTYMLTVSLARAASPKDVLVKGTLNGSLVAASAGPLEFNLDQNGIEVSGAIALSFVHE